LANLEYKCPCCGGAIAFDSNVQKMKCPYCDTEYEIETLREYDKALNEEQAESMEWEKPTEETDDSTVNLFVCNSCGGQLVADENTAATCCPYCGNPQILTSRLSGSLKPDCVIPFQLDKKDAINGYFRHIKGKTLLPSVFKDENHIDKLTALYVPFWLFDADASARIRYRATRVTFWSDSKYDYTKTSHYAVFRAGGIGFANIPVDGSSHMPDDLMESIEPFDVSKAIDFQTAVLAGYLADKYDVDADSSIGRANERVRTSTVKAFEDTVIGYNTVMTEASTINLSNGKIKYALYPVWLLNTTYEGKKYLFAMNGQTGKFVGDLPYDKKKLVSWLFGLAGSISAVSFLIALLVYFL